MYIASIDCGTTNSRVYILDETGTIVGKGTRRVGVRDTSRTGSKDTLRDGLVEALYEALSESGLTLSDISFAITAGMITSEIGLVEIPHLQTPIGLRELAGGIKVVDDRDIFPVEIPLYFIPGIRNRYDLSSASQAEVGLLDFMRGEEVQAMGYLDSIQEPGSRIMVMLSSHTKFIHMNESGKVTQSLTSLSGQVFEAVKKESFIGKSIEPVDGVVEPEGYLDPQVIENALHWQEEGGFIRTLLMIRFLDVLLHNQWYERKLFFEALIAAEDLQMFRQFRLEDGEQPTMLFIGPKGRCDVYEYLFEHALGWPKEKLKQMTDTKKIDMLNIYGSLSIAREAGLLTAKEE